MNRVGEQPEIPWDDVAPPIPPGDYPSEEAWVHATKCMCGGCRERRMLLALIRKAQYAARCEADLMTQAERVRYYRKRARRKLPLFERGPLERQKSA